MFKHNSYIRCNLATQPSPGVSVAQTRVENNSEAHYGEKPYTSQTKPRAQETPAQDTTAPSLPPPLLPTHALLIGGIGGKCCTPKPAAGQRSSPSHVIQSRKISSHPRKPTASCQYTAPSRTPFSITPSPPPGNATHLENTRFRELEVSWSSPFPSSWSSPAPLPLPTVEPLAGRGREGESSFFPPSDNASEGGGPTAFLWTPMPWTAPQQESLLCFPAPPAPGLVVVPRRQAARMLSQSIVSRWFKSSSVAISASTLPASMAIVQHFQGKIVFLKQPGGPGGGVGA